MKRIKRWFQRLIHKIRQRFGKTYDVHSGRVRDTVRFDGDLTLFVDGNAWQMLFAIEAAREAAKNVKIDSPEEERREAAMRFATAIFGAEQAEKLMDYYNGDAGTVLGVCGQYISERLIKRITSVQKKQK